MSLTLYNSIGWAVEKQTIAAGGGLTGPVLVSATSTDPNTVRLVFDRKLMLEYRQAGVYHAATLDLASFAIAKVSGGEPLEVVRTIWINDTTIDLATANQQVFSYRVTCFAGGVMDFQGNVITLQTADFTGQQRTTYTTPSDIRMFTSGYPGMQEDETNDFDPDLEAPYIEPSTQDPTPGETDVALDAHITFDLKDDESGVALTTVRIWVEGNLAYRGDTDAFQVPYNGAASARTGTPASYNFVIEKTSDWTSFQTVGVRVLAQDLAAIPNELDTSYSFETVDVQVPYLDNLTPAPDDEDVPGSTNITLQIHDAGGGVSASSVWIKVNGTFAWTGDAQQPGFVVAKTVLADGFQYVINPNSDFSSFETVSVQVYAEDEEVPPNFLDETYDFRTADVEAPYLQGQVPAPSAPNIPIDTTVILEVVDDGYGVQASSVILRVNGTIAWTGDAQQPGFTVVKTAVAGGFHYVITPAVEFGEGTTPVIRAQASDLAPVPNTLDTTYSFTCVLAPPFLQNWNPAENEHDVVPTSTVYLEVMDNESGVDPDTVIIEIDTVVCWQNRTQHGPYLVTETPISGGKGFAYHIQPLGLLPENSTVRVDVYAEDHAAAVLDEFYVFYTTFADYAIRAPLGAFYCDRVELETPGLDPCICNRFPPPPIEAGIETGNGTFDLRATGSIVVVAPTLFSDGEAFVIDDGVNPSVYFIFDQSGVYVPPGGYDATHVRLNVSAMTTASQVRDAVISAVNGAASLDVLATSGGTDLVNLRYTSTGFGSLTITDTVAIQSFVVTGMTSERKLVLRTGRRSILVISGHSDDSITQLTRIIKAGSGPFISGHVGKLLQVRGATNAENNRDYTITQYLDAYRVVVEEEPAASEGPHIIFDPDFYDGVFVASTDESCTFVPGDFTSPSAATPAEVVAAFYAHGMTFAGARVAREDTRVRFLSSYELIQIVSAPVAFGLTNDAVQQVLTHTAGETANVSFSIYSPSASLPKQTQITLRLAGTPTLIYDHLLAYTAPGWTVIVTPSSSPSSGVDDNWDIVCSHATAFASEDKIQVAVYAELFDGRYSNASHIFDVEDWQPPVASQITVWDRSTLRVHFSDNMKGDEETGPTSSLHVRDVSGRISYHQLYTSGLTSYDNVIEAPIANFTADEVGLFLGSARARNARNNGAFEILERLSSSLVRVDAMLVDEDPADLSKDELAPTVVISPYRVVAPTTREATQPIFCPIVVSATRPDLLTLKPLEAIDRYVHVHFQDDLTPAVEYILEITRIEDTSDNPIGSLYPFTSWTPGLVPGRSFALWDMIPEMNKREDKTQELERFIRSCDEPAQVMLADVDQFGLLLEPMRTKDEVVDVLLEHLGNPLAFVRGLSLQKKRELIPLLIPMFKKRGIDAGIEDSVAFFLGKTVVVTPFDIPATTWTLGVSQLNYNTYVGPSRSRVRYSFYIDHSEALSSVEMERIREIVEFVRPAHTHFIGFREV